MDNKDKFNPDDLKKQWPGKYDDWKFELNGRKEWIGYFKKQMGVIVAAKDKNGTSIPDLKLREAISTGGFGLNSISIGWSNFRKAKR
jgi:hypothetical protein